jgi:hypothetical protein
LEQRDAEEAGRIRLTYKGQTPPWRIIRLVQPQTFCALEPRDDIDALLQDAGRNLAAARDADAGPRVS